ncbi:MAG TPA: MFS transporter [Dokdonella sp.]|uniref:MFS transporter n=1 Tax=Dokdonella sp. TaxID=2291710 RepID=UPI0025BBD06A|nr:MFS transporter [Dokdonella sp.]MBX3692730.1 MFS transporter [Dokdonella sp.]MCW5567679.1 MFS transporter [Dokdonella sp.]HNR91123.1 MFS transporter [Dokdonella sp.]
MSTPAADIPSVPATSPGAVKPIALPLLVALSLCHLLNDLIQSLLPAVYPLLKERFALDFGQIGLITLTWQFTASLLQPLVGIYTDRHPQPYSLAFGMGSTLIGLVLLSQATGFALLLVAAALIGTGSSVFHPESSRIARMASGGRHGFAQSLFQVGGNIGSAIGPLLAAFIVMPRGQGSIGWFAIAALAGIIMLARIGRWYAAELAHARRQKHVVSTALVLPRGTVVRALFVLGLLVFSKYFYLASLTSYYTFYLMARFGLDARSAQLHLFAFLGAVAAGTLVGGPVGDRIGRRYVIWGSILGVLPFTVLLPHANLGATTVLTIVIGFVLASAFAAILVYAQELVPGRTGTVSGLFFGFAFGMGGLGAAVLGQLADRIGIEAVYAICAWLPAIGLLAWFLPKTKPHHP